MEEKLQQVTSMYVELLKKSDEDLCGDHCKNYIRYEGEDCPHYDEGVGGTIDGRYQNFKWTCQDWEHGTCPVLVNTPCNGCFDSKNYDGFEWKGIDKNG